ncbi:hypothetical protein [Bathycoccus sp. RCC716 virus 1]|uniref:Uncharacterized protein n=1 Tax=Bathycoccus sp. RCC716 virus 1 TaxID=2530038 RepID=A0A7S6NY23_9PHYC|nr:hypothetical protein [Bathycoccus sp. RCC716 virus 1]
MILVLAIILFIIFLIYSIKPRREEYTLEGLKLSWKNKASIEGVVTKWIITLKDSSGNVIHTYENNESKNLKNFTDVTMNIVDKKEFESSIIGNNTLELYYNEIKPDTKLYTKTVTFTEEDFGGITLDMNKLEEVQEFKPAFSYEFIMNKKNQTLGIHIEYIKLDGVLATKAQTTIHKPPNRNNKPDNMFSIGSGTVNYAAWNANGHNVGDKIFTIVSDKKVDKIDIVYTRPRYAPGWIIKENGVAKITETFNRGNNMTPRPVVYTYNIKDGTSSPPTFSYEFIMNKKNQTLGIHVGWIKLDGVLATKEQTTIHKPPNRNNNSNHMFTGDNNYSSWNANGHNVGDKIFTIESNKQIEKIDISYARPRYGPGWIIKENGVAKITETSNRGNNLTPSPAVYTYNIKDGTTSSLDPMKQFTTGEWLYMKGGKSEYKKYCRDYGTKITCTTDNKNNQTRFAFKKNSDGTYSFRGGRYNKWCADEGWRIKCDRGGIGSWEKFRINRNSDGTYSFRGGRDNKWCADEGNTIRCNRGGIGSWERFKIGKA